MAEATNLRLALAQIDPTVGDVEGNVRLISESIESARDHGAQLVLLPELCVSGYPPEDLLLRRDFLAAVREGLDAIAAEVEGIVALVGFPERVERSPEALEHFDPLIDPPLPGLQLARDRRRSRGPGHLPQVRSPELRRLRRAALFRAGQRRVSD
jgi:predicted amidohydrolase